VLRVVRIAFIAYGILAILGGLVACAFQYWGGAIGGITTGAMILFLFWWFPRRSLSREF
jgi:hypothetical protein